MAFVACQALLKLADFQEMVRVNERAKLAQECDVLADIPSEALEVWVLLDEALHVLHCLDAGCRCRLRLELDDVLFN